jgi:tetratricopeptide (TPR) repeat protein
MLIGADFMLSHRIYIARSQDKLYFTYNGGPVFRLDSAPAPPPVTEATAAAPPAPGAAVPAGDQPTDASGYARRGAAASARREYPQAIDDFTHAMALAPADPQLAYDRAMARLGNRQPLLAVSDLDQALKLKPDFTLALLGRGRLKLADRDPDGARADFEAAARIDPQLRLEIAQAYEAVGLMQPAVDNYDQWIAANPKDERLAFALNGRCWARALANHELQIALADCDRALKLRPSTAEFLDSRGLVRLRLGQYQQAIGDYDAALRLQPQIAWAHYGRGVAELKTGRAADGEADLKAADDISPVVVARARRLGIGPDAPAAGAATTAAPAAKP